MWVLLFYIHICIFLCRTCCEVVCVCVEWERVSEWNKKYLVVQTVSRFRFRCDSCWSWLKSYSYSCIFLVLFMFSIHIFYYTLETLGIGISCVYCFSFYLYWYRVYMLCLNTPTSNHLTCPFKKCTGEIYRFVKHKWVNSKFKSTHTHLYLRYLQHGFIQVQKKL